MIRKQATRGAAAVELALVLVPLTMIVLATIDFARAIYTYTELVKITREGARYLSFFDPSVANQYPVTAAKNRMLYGSVTAPTSGTPLVRGLSASMILICDRVTATSCPGEIFSAVPTGSGQVDLVKVTISGYVFSPIFPGASQLGSFTFEPISTTMQQL